MAAKKKKQSVPRRFRAAYQRAVDESGKRESALHAPPQPTSLASKTIPELRSLFESTAAAALRRVRAGTKNPPERRSALDIIDELAARGEFTGEQEHHELWTGDDYGPAYGKPKDPAARQRQATKELIIKIARGMGVTDRETLSLVAAEAAEEVEAELDQQWKESIVAQHLITMGAIDPEAE